MDCDLLSYVFVYALEAASECLDLQPRAARLDAVAAGFRVTAKTFDASLLPYIEARAAFFVDDGEEEGEEYHVTIYSYLEPLLHTVEVRRSDDDVVRISKIFDFSGKMYVLSATLGEDVSEDFAAVARDACERVGGMVY